MAQSSHLGTRFPVRKRIVVPGLECTPGLARLLGLLARHIPFVAEDGSIESAAAADGLVLATAADNRSPDPGFPRPTLLAPGYQSSDPTPSAQYEFGKTDLVPTCFRGRALRFDNPGLHLPVANPTGDTVLADSSGRPVWTVDRRDGATLDRVGIGLPLLAPEQPLLALLNPRSFLRVLPLLDYLRRITRDLAWVSSGTRACFMFDDPNLHSTRYGHIDYRELARRAERRRYHVAIATVPLDAWRAAPEAATVFHSHREHLSLLVHGNNHVYRELGRPLASSGRQFLARQALARVSHLENKTGLVVDRVMAPPHGACSEAMLATLAEEGFKGACISHASLRNHNSGGAWVEDLGIESVRCVATLPVLPRFRLSKTCLPAVLLCSYLGQPIIPVGHHQDVSDGLALLDEVADLINSLGSVEWCGVGPMLDRAFELQRSSEAGSLRVRVRARSVALSVPADVSRIQVDTGCLLESFGPVVVRSLAATERPPQPGDDGWWRVHPGSTIAIELSGAKPIRSEVPSSFLGSPWALLRREMCIARDRFQGLSGRVRRGFAAA